VRLQDRVVVAVAHRQLAAAPQEVYLILLVLVALE
jgi:hypothetical protein